MHEPDMYTSVNSRSAAAYQRVGLETSVDGASAHKLIDLLFDALLQAITQATNALAANDIARKGQQITKAVRILDEGLKPALNLEQGGDLARNLRDLYDFCVRRLTQANLHNDKVALDDVDRVIRPVATGWKEIATKVPR